MVNWMIIAQYYMTGPNQPSSQLDTLFNPVFSQIRLLFQTFDYQS